MGKTTTRKSIKSSKSPKPSKAKAIPVIILPIDVPADKQPKAVKISHPKKLVEAESPSGGKVRAGRYGVLVKVKHHLKCGKSSQIYSHIRVQNSTDQIVSMLFTDEELSRAHRRAKANPQDCPTVSWIRDIFEL